jgi:predicted deacetylase
MHGTMRELSAGKSAPQRIAVALHDIEPATFQRCALIRDWLDDHGVDRATLLVIPARDLHPLGMRCPQMASWLTERRRAGDSIAQHGFQHAQPRLRRPGAIPVRSGERRAAEFIGLDPQETRRALDAGWRVLKLAGLEPDGFVAPAYAYTPALRRLLSRRFRWWAGLWYLHRCAVHPDGQPRELLAPAVSMGAHNLLRRTLAPPLIRAGGLFAGRTLRLDLHPSNLRSTREVRALEWVLGRAGQRRQAITYDALLAEAFDDAGASGALARATRPAQRGA